MGRSRSRSRGYGDEDHIQKLVDERQECRRARDFDRADKIRDELRDMGIQVNDTELTWRGQGGMSGRVSGNGGGGGGGGSGIQRRDGDWDCTSCGKMNFAYRSECFACGTPREGGGRTYDRRFGDGGRGFEARRDSPDRRYDDRRYDDRRSDDRRYDDRRFADRRYDNGGYDDRRCSRRSDSRYGRRRRDDSRMSRRYR